MMKMLIKNMRALTLPITTAVTEMKTAVATMSSMKQTSGERPRTGLDPARERRPFHQAMDQLQDQFNCYFCDERGHTKPKCPHLRQLIEDERIHINDERKICLGSFKEGAAPVWKLPGMSMFQTVQRQLNMKEAPTAADFGMIRADLDSDTDLEVGEEQYVDAYGARANVQRGKRPAVTARPAVTDPVRDARTRATKQIAQKQSNYPTMKSLRTGDWVRSEGGLANDESSGMEPEDREPAGMNQNPSRDITVGPEENMPDASAKPPKVPRTSLKKLLAGQADPMSVIERMMQQQVTISWAEALSLSGDLRKIMFGTFKDPKVSLEPTVEARISKMKAEMEYQEEYASEVLDKIAAPLCIAASPMAVVNIGQRRIPALIDSGAEVTVMTSDLADDLGLPISEDFNVNMSAATGKSRKFIGLCEDVPIAVGKIVHKVPVWVIDKLEHGLVLGRTYHKASGLKLEEVSDGSCNATIYTPDRTGMVRWRAVSATAKRNQSREDLMNKHALNSQAEV